MQCTKCNSDNTQRLTVVYEHGTQNINTTGHSAGVGDVAGSLGFGGVRTKTRGTSKTTMAQKASPPEKKPMKAGVILAIIGFFCFSGHGNMKIIAAVLMAVGAYNIYRAISYNSNKWPELYRYWSNSWLCNKCGTIYHQEV
jgi:hypothetical protein